MKAQMTIIEAKVKRLSDLVTIKSGLSSNTDYVTFLIHSSLKSTKEVNIDLGMLDDVQNLVDTWIKDELKTLKVEVDIAEYEMRPKEPINLKKITD